MPAHRTTISRFRGSLAPLAVGAVAAAALAGCGSGGDGGSTTTGAGGAGTAAGGGGGGATGAATAPQGTASTRLALTADEQGGLFFSRRELTAQAGEVTISLDNPSGNGLPHAVEIEGHGVEEESGTIEPGATTQVTANLRPGTYTFYCPVDGHREAGMRGTLTVR